MLNANIESFKGVGVKTKKYFNEASIFTIKDLVLYTPYKYNVYKDFDPSLEDKSMVLLNGVIDSSVMMPKFKRMVDCLIFYVKTSEFRIKVMVFGQKYLLYNIKKGAKVSLSGIYNKSNEYINLKKISFTNFVSNIDVVYNIKDIKDQLVSKILKEVFENYKIDIKEYFIPSLITKYRLLDINNYLYLSHFPKSIMDVNQIFRRKKYEMYFKNCLMLESLSYYYDTTKKEEKVFLDSDIFSFIDKLDITPTIDQLKAINEIKDDLKSDRIMNRLVQGDVGSGKTLVAAISCLMAYKSSYQIAFMAPTEVLAIQTFNVLNKMFINCDISLRLLTSSTLNKEKQEIIELNAQGRINLLVGTHSLIYDNIKFKNLGLVIIDEQHKFGVMQRQKLINKNKTVDALYLSATPIPRTLGISKFGDLDISSIHSKIDSRKDILTKTLTYNDLNNVYDDINNEVRNKHQIFVVSQTIYPNNENYSVLECYDLMKDNICGNVSFIHGDLSRDEINKRLEDFKKGKIDVLVSTTIIEVGVDIKNATLMVIFEANRFGLSQLHQLRGRVGRNSFFSSCILLSKEKNERLDMLVSCSDCFMLSEYDLEIRGPGDILGEKQSGFFMYNKEADMNIYNCAKKDAQVVYNDYINNKCDLTYVLDIMEYSLNKKIIN